MEDSQKNKITGGKEEDQNLKEMKFNSLILKPKLLKFKEKDKEFIQNKNIDKKYSTNKTSKPTDKNNNILNNNAINFVSKKESKDIKSSINNQDYIINNNSNNSLNNIHYTKNDGFFNDQIIKKDNKIRELLIENKQLKKEIKYKDNIIESLKKEIKILKQNKTQNENNKDLVLSKNVDETNIEIEKLFIKKLIKTENPNKNLLKDYEEIIKGFNKKKQNVKIIEDKKNKLSESNKINYINIDRALNETYEKLMETADYKEIKNKKFQFLFMDNKEITTHLFNYKIITYLTREYKICRANYWAEKQLNIMDINVINPRILENIKTTDEIQIYNNLSYNKLIIFFILKLVFEKFAKNVKKLYIYQIGLKILDESLFTIVASYLNINENITHFALCGRSLDQFDHLKKQIEDPFIRFDRNEKLEQEIQNIQHFFNLYQILSKKSNLVELRLIVLLNSNIICMLANILKNNTKLKILEINNISKVRDNESDNTFEKMSDIRDELFIFFNNLFEEDNITELRITNFNFCSQINFMAVQAAKTMKNIEILILENFEVVNNNDFLDNAYNLSFLPLKKLNMGRTHFMMINKWDSLINPFNLEFLDLGSCDFNSFTSLCSYLEDCHCEKVIIRLDKPVTIENVPVLFDIISGSPMRSKYLKYFYVLNAIKDVKENPDYKNKYLPRLFNCFRYSKVMRKLSFDKPCKQYYEIKDVNNDENSYEDNNEYIYHIGDEYNNGDENDYESDNNDDDICEDITEDVEKDDDKYNEYNDNCFHTFKYIKKRDYNSAIFLIKAMNKLFWEYKGNKKYKVDNLIRKIIMYRFLTYRKLYVA